jgi:transposase
VPHGHWKTTTFLAALRHDRITAPCIFDGAINGERFRYIEQGLAPTLGPGDLMIMDNLGAHKVQGVREAIEARGAACSTCRRTRPTSQDGGVRADRGPHGAVRWCTARAAWWRSRS